MCTAYSAKGQSPQQGQGNDGPDRHRQQTHGRRYRRRGRRGGRGNAPEGFQARSRAEIKHFCPKDCIFDKSYKGLFGRSALLIEL